MSELFEAEGGNTFPQVDEPIPALETEAEGGNTFPQVDEPIPALETEEVVMIIFDGDSQPVRLDQLTWEQEWMLENGCYYRYYVTEKPTCFVECGELVRRVGQ